MNSFPVIQIASNAQVPFEIHSMEWIEQNRWQQNSTPHRHNYFVIIWLKKGHGTHRVDFSSYPLEDDTVYCISPGQVHQLSVDGPVDGSVISFTNDFLGSSPEGSELLYATGLFDYVGNAPLVKVCDDMKEDMEEAISRMMKEYSNYFLLRSEILRGFLRIFLIYLTRQYEQPHLEGDQPRNVELVRGFFSQLEKNYLTHHKVIDYASTLVVTPNYLNEIIKKLTGFPASHHIHQRIVLEAKRQAAYTNNTMKEVAYHLGFDDIAHFSKFFKKVAGQSFSEFKKNLSFQSNSRI